MKDIASRRKTGGLSWACMAGESVTGTVRVYQRGALAETLTQDLDLTSFGSIPRLPPVLVYVEGSHEEER